MRFLWVPKTPKWKVLKKVPKRVETLSNTKQMFRRGLKFGIRSLSWIRMLKLTPIIQTWIIEYTIWPWISRFSNRPINTLAVSWGESVLCFNHFREMIRWFNQQFYYETIVLLLYCFCFCLCINDKLVCNYINDKSEKSNSNLSNSLGCFIFESGMHNKIYLAQTNKYKVGNSNTFTQQHALYSCGKKYALYSCQNSNTSCGQRDFNKWSTS